MQRRAALKRPCQQPVAPRSCDRWKLLRMCAWGATWRPGGDYVQAAESFGRAEALSPGEPSVGYNLGLAHWKAGERAEADRAWRHARARSPKALPVAASNHPVPGAAVAGPGD